MRYNAAPYIVHIEDRPIDRAKPKGRRLSLSKKSFLNFGMRSGRERPQREGQSESWRRERGVSRDTALSSSLTYFCRLVNLSRARARILRSRNTAVRPWRFSKGERSLTDERFAPHALILPAVYSFLSDPLSCFPLFRAQQRRGVSIRNKRVAFRDADTAKSIYGKAPTGAAGETFPIAYSLRRGWSIYGAYTDRIIFSICSSTPAALVFISLKLCSR